MRPSNTPATAAKAPTRGDAVFDAIVDLIHDCERAPGMVVNETALAARFNVSRGPVREAIRRLQGIQLVSRAPYMKARVVSLSRQAILELFQAREALEGFACRLATQRMTDVELVRLIADLDGARGRKALAGGRFDFHQSIVRASGNQRIIDMLCGDLYHLLRIYRRMSGALPKRKELALAEHWQIIRAIKSRDAELAESLMRSHIARAARHVLDHVPSVSRGVGNGIELRGTDHV